MNFTDKQFATIKNVLGDKFNTRINKSGNITVEYIPEFNVNRPKTYNKFWTLYKVNDNYLWRRHIGYGYCYPLNMIGRKRLGPYYICEHDGKKYYACYRDFNIKNCEFTSFDAAVEYFVKYLKKYKNIAV